MGKLNQVTPAETHATQHNAYRYAEKFFYNAFLRGSPAVEAFRQRGISVQTLRAFHAGYAPKDGQSTLRFLNRWYTNDELYTCGIASKTDNYYYSFFRDRIVVPIHDANGNTVAFGGRDMEYIKGNPSPKYLNSPESTIFKKSQLLFNFNRAKTDIQRTGQVYIVEGYMDVLSLYQAGITNVVAVMGTTLTRDHLALLSNAKHITLCFDGDKAGRDAALRALNTMMPFLKKELTVDFMFCPHGEDPDSVIQKQGINAFNALAQQAIRSTGYALQEIAVRYPATDAASLACRWHALKKLFQNAKPGYLRTHLLPATGSMLGLHPNSLFNMMNNS
ncbi:MAG: toprim domain-containing protein [Pseudomonadales bacterium]